MNIEYEPFGIYSGYVDATPYFQRKLDKHFETSTCEHIGTSPMSKRISVAEQTLKKQIDRILADEMRIQNEIELRIHVGKELANQREALEAEMVRIQVNRAAATPK